MLLFCTYFSSKVNGDDLDIVVPICMQCAKYHSLLCYKCIMLCYCIDFFSFFLLVCNIIIVFVFGKASISQYAVKYWYNLQLVPTHFIKVAYNVIENADGTSLL